MVGGSHYFWLGASADAETGHSAEPEPVTRLGPPGECPARKEECLGCGLKLDPGEWGYCSLKCLVAFGFDERWTAQ
jgi:hypothetical protein